MQDRWVKVAVTGGTGVIGRGAVDALVTAGHQVDVACRSAANVASVLTLGANPRSARVSDVGSLTALFEGADAVVNLASQVPVGYPAALAHSWKRADELRTTGVANVVAAARAAGVRRLVQGSMSSVYADAGDAWITEHDPVEITPTTEPIAVGESYVQDYAGGFRAGVLLRFGTIVGDDPQTRFWLRAAAAGRPVGIGRPDQWSHLIHTDDLGSSVLAALRAPSGVYNVGAEPVRRGEVVEAYANACGVEHATFFGPVLRRLAGARIEPLTRSLRVSSAKFVAQTGWAPSRPVFEPGWLEDVVREPEHAR